jgi:hypothetical protein
VVVGVTGEAVDTAVALVMPPARQVTVSVMVAEEEAAIVDTTKTKIRRMPTHT